MTRSVFNDIRFPLLILLFMLQAFLTLRLDWTTSPNRTELGHIAGALHLYETGEFDLFHVNPPLLRFLIAPAVCNTIQPRTDWTDYSTDPMKRSEWACGVAFVRANDLEIVQKTFFIGRIVYIPLILLGGYFGYRYARELFGEVAGFVFLILWIFSPLILGWGATICPDVVRASLGIIALYAFRLWILNPTGRNTVLAGLTLGLLPLTKLTWIVALGIFPLVFFVTLFFNREHVFKRIGQLMLMLAITVLTINAGYLFDGSFKLLGSYDFHSKALTDEDGKNRFIGTVLQNIPVPFPEHFVQGFDTQKVDFEKGMKSYLLGEHRDHGWSYYYLVALAVKEPIGTIILFAVALSLFCFKKFRTDVRDELILLISMMILFITISSQTGFSVHSRYIVPVLPFLYLWISRTGMLLNTRRKYVAGSILGILLCTNISSVLSVYPSIMSYSNEVFRDRRPPILLGSNLDWGQDYYELKDYLDEHPEAKPLYVVLENIFPIDILGIHKAGTPPRWTPGQEAAGTWRQQIQVGPRPGWYLLGANELFSGDYRWFWEVRPVKRIGYSLYLYNITLDEANQLREKGKLPMLIEDDNPVNSE